MNLKKQTKVGGILTISFLPELKPHNTDAPDAEDWVADGAPVVIPNELWTMHNPSIELTLNSASGLARANMFGGSSDPFVMIYVGDAEEPVDKTKVITNSLDPEWHQTFTLTLGVSDAQRDSTMLEDFPTIRLEVYDYNAVKAMDFLGMCEIKPARYFGRPSADMKLLPMPDKKKKLVQGRLSASFALVDNVVGISKQEYLFTHMRSLQSLAYVEVHILKGKNLMKANRVGKSDPYVIVRWNGKKYGVTTYKKNTFNPAWNNEKFLINVSRAGYEVGELVLEVWDKDFFKEGDFMGEVRLSGDILLHPSSTNLELPLGAKPGKPLGKIKGTLTFKVISRVITQRPPCLQPKVLEWQPISSKMEPQPLIMAFDPEQEAKRQQREGSEFKTILDRTSKQMDKYLNHPFERTGLISELHYGQLTAASRRAEHTILKTDKVDMMCVPTFRKGFRQECTMYIVSRYEPGQIPRRDIQFMNRLHAGICRGIEHMTQRDDRAKALATLEGTLKDLATTTDSPTTVVSQGLLELEVGLRCGVRMFFLAADGESFLRFSVETGDIDQDNPNADELIHTAAKICRHNFALQRYRGEEAIISYDWSAFTQLTVADLGASSGAAMETFDALEGANTLKKLLQLCDRQHPDGTMLVPLIAGGGVAGGGSAGGGGAGGDAATAVAGQAGSGSGSGGGGAGSEVLLGILQLVGLDKTPSAKHRILVEEDSADAAGNSDNRSTAKSLQSLGNNSQSSGVVVAAEGTGGAHVERPYITVEKLEHGFANSVMRCSRHLADSLMASRLSNVYRKIRSLPIKADTPPLMVIRYAFRMLVTAIPAIREVSLWVVDVNADVHLVANKEEDEEDTVKKRGFLGRLLDLLTGGGSGGGGDRGVAADAIEMDQQQQKELQMASTASEKKAVLEEMQLRFKQRKPPILAGFFGSENPNMLLGTALERGAGAGAGAGVGAAAATTTPGQGRLTPQSLQNPTGRAGQFSRHRRTNAAGQVAAHAELIDRVRLEAAEQAAQWTVDVPNVLRKEPSVSAGIRGQQGEGKGDDGTGAAGAGAGAGAGGSGGADGNAIDALGVDSVGEDSSVQSLGSGGDAPALIAGGDSSSSSAAAAASIANSQRQQSTPTIPRFTSFLSNNRIISNQATVSAAAGAGAGAAGAGVASGRPIFTEYEPMKMDLIHAEVVR